MKFDENEPPRRFTVSMGITLSDCGRIELAADEQVTFAAEGTEYDFCRKSWGYYASPSLNSRMGRFGLRPALVKSHLNGTFFMLAVIKGREAEFADYLSHTAQELVVWLDDARALAGLAPERRCLCGGGEFEPVFHYDAPPTGEVVFEFSKAGYKREVVRCLRCGHFLSVHALDMSGMYSKEYVDSTYGAKLRSTYDRIVSLPAEKSDNAGRVAHVCFYAESRRRRGAEAPTILDVGSGLCVFLRGMKARGWDGTALDPDARAAEHARDVVGVKAVAADFMAAEGLGRFDAVSFNKVLEHAVDPVAMLRRAHPFLARGGFVYVELPDGEGAVKDGPGREEFFIDHHHVFSSASYCVLAAKAGFRVDGLQSLREPSGKFTLRGFLCPL